MKGALAGSLAGADLVFCYTKGLGWDARPVLAPLGVKSKTFDEFKALVGAVVDESREGDHILVMSNGDFGGVHAKILEALKPSSTA
jgi:UDP-N-acetylmuramate: L-alanyl-gamma-D-glutamyl-meso-diaminopimelate ligase